MSVGDARAADRWWHELPDDRRVQICSWITQSSGRHVPEIPGQLELIRNNDEEGGGGDHEGIDDHL